MVGGVDQVLYCRLINDKIFFGYIRCMKIKKKNINILEYKNSPYELYNKDFYIYK